MRREYEITCPNCTGWIIIDLETGDVLQHGTTRARPAASKRGKGKDSKAFDQAVDRVTRKPGGGSDPFDDAVRALRDQKQKLERAFDEARKRAEQEPDEDPPPPPGR